MIKMIVIIRVRIIMIMKKCDNNPDNNPDNIDINKTNDND